MPCLLFFDWEIYLNLDAPLMFVTFLGQVYEIYPQYCRRKSCKFTWRNCKKFTMNESGCANDNSEWYLLCNFTFNIQVARLNKHLPEFLINSIGNILNSSTTLTDIYKSYEKHSDAGTSSKCCSNVMTLPLNKKFARCCEAYDNWVVTIFIFENTVTQD